MTSLLTRGSAQQSVVAAWGWHSCQALGGTCMAEQEKAANKKERYIVENPESRYLKSNIPRADAHLSRPSCLGTSR